MQNAIIRAERVEKYYPQPSENRIQVISPTDLAIVPGEIVALLGPSGSGKSTLLRMLTGLSVPSAGQVYWHEKPIATAEVNVSIVFQSFALFPWLTVLENVEAPLVARGVDAESRRRQGLKMLDTVGLDGFQGAYPKELSGGMRQRVGFARALVVEPEVLFMDEPFSALDVLTAENLRSELLELWQKKTIPTQSIFIVTHNIEEAVLLADRIIVLGRNPGHIRTDFRVNLSHPRDRKAPAFTQLVDYIYKVLTQPDQQPPALPTTPAGKQQSAARKQHYQMLPHARPGGIAGLLELLIDHNGKDDIYRLADDLGFEIDDLLPIVDAGQLLGFLTVIEGDAAITPKGSEYANSEILRQKELFRAAAVENVLLLRQIVKAIEAKSDGTVSEEFFHDMLDEQFTEEETLRQLETAINWGRFAELFDFDAARRRFRRTEKLHDEEEEFTSEMDAVIQLPGNLNFARVQQTRQTLARAQVLKRSWPFFLDLTVAALCLAAFYGVLKIAGYWLSSAQPQFTVSLAPSSLPLYAFYSVVRIGLAYLLSLVFAVGYGYIAAYNTRAESLMIAALDILQSIPVLSFLPGVMLAMVALFPTKQLGVEMGAIVLIFTGQVWNMAFSFYSSLKSLPRELGEASRIYGFSTWQRFWQLELPYGTIGLVWNSMISVAGGWFFLMACEMFVLGDRDFRLPGLGSYLQTAASADNVPAMVYGILTVIAIIVATDQLVWRPVIAWSDKFKIEQSASADRISSPILQLLQRSNALAAIQRHTLAPLSERIYHVLAERHRQQRARLASEGSTEPPFWMRMAILAVLACGILYAAASALLKLRDIQGPQYLLILEGAGATFLRVNLSLLLAAAWTIPAGVAIGFNPRLARIVQPVVQVAASFPAPILFPIIILGLMKLGGGLGIGSIALMLLGTQWYILFNVIAGAMAIPSDLREVSTLFRFTRWQQWRTVILPGIFPYLITGMVTASGGAWNASIIAEYFHLKGQTLHTLGLGAQISAASDKGQFQVLLLATIVMALMVVTVNRLVWRPLYGLAETKYKLEG